MLEFLGIQPPNTRDLTFADSTYLVEVSDTLTRFIPAASLATKNIEFRDILVLVFLLLLLPDYKKWRNLFGSAFEPTRKNFSMNQWTTS